MRELGVGLWDGRTRLQDLAGAGVNGSSISWRKKIERFAKG